MPASTAKKETAERLMSAARALLARGDTRFTVARLCAKARVKVDDFNRVFGTRTALFEALMAPPITSAADAALEHRLRDFEQGLERLADRLATSQHDQALAIAKLEQKFTAQPSAIPVQGIFAQASRHARQGAARISRHLTQRGPSRISVAAVAAFLLALMVGVPLLETARGSTAERSSDPIVLLTSRAERGDAQAQSALAFAYLGSPGITRDVSSAAHWAQSAAAQGDANAQYLIGSLSLSGTGVPRDPQQAISWFTRSAAAGNVKAMHNLAIAYVQGNGTPKNPAAAATWFARAASQGYVDSAFDLAVLYEQGLGVPQNVPEALRWYRVAAKAGDRSAAARAHILESDGQP